MNENLTVGEWQRLFSSRHLSTFTASECRQIAKSFLQKVLQVPSAELLLLSRNVLTNAQIEELFKMEEELVAGKPVQYILKEAFFADVLLDLSHEVLIPRPETEELVYWIHDSIDDHSISLHDFCSGSGCIALALKSLNPKWEITASDFSAESLLQIHKNKEQLELAVAIQELDVLNTSNRHSISTFDVMVSNPPYIPIEERSAMAKHVVYHEPPMALFVEDDDPLIFYRNLLEIAVEKLKENGWVYFEIHENFATEISDLLSKFGFVDIQVKQDLQGRNRMVRGRTSKSI